ncbi:MAG: AhpC/TSA family protein [Bacteroidetes bacterium]|nr:AhpC/TSA family protein [Bacteroidota bacterium]
MHKMIILFLLNAVVISALTAQEQQEKYKKATEAEGLKAGADAFLFRAGNQNYNIYDLNKNLENGPVVLIFYRGQWCPVCSKHLSNLQDSLEFIYGKGASVVAISPEKPEYLQKTAGKTGAKFSLVYDEGYKISNAYGVTFRPDSATRALYNTVLKANLKNAHSDESSQLPVPATYIIGQDKKITWAHFDPDYKIRASVAEIIENL